MKPELHIAPTKTAWVDQAVETIHTAAHQAIAERGYFTLVLSGGSTPAPVYTRLAERSTEMDWRKTFVFWGDERCVPPTHQDSNYRMAKETLLDHLPTKPEQIFRIMGEIEPDAAAQDYEGVIAAFFHQRQKMFDLILLGLGDDGHTASLFPGTDGLKEQHRWVIPNIHPYTNTWRISLTYPALNQARQIVFLVAGSGKADVAADCIQHPDAPPPYPAKKVSGSTAPPLWLLDSEAAKNINILI